MISKVKHAPCDQTVTEQNNRAAVKLLCPSHTSVHHSSVISRSRFIDHTFYISAHGHNFLWRSRARSQALPGLTWAARCDGWKSCFVSAELILTSCLCAAVGFYDWTVFVMLVIRLWRIIKTVILFCSDFIFCIYGKKHQKHLGCKDDAFRALRAEMISQFID